MKKYIIALALFCPALAGAQDLRHPWTLQECLDWALEHSLTVKQGELNLAQQEIQTNTTENSWLPSVSASANESVNFGRGLTADNTYTSANTTSTGFSIGAGMNLFDGLATPNNISLARLNLEAATKDLERIRDDIRVAVARAYVQVLYDYEIVESLAAEGLPRPERRDARAGGEQPPARPAGPRPAVGVHLQRRLLRRTTHRGCR